MYPGGLARISYCGCRGWETLSFELISCFLVSSYVNCHNGFGCPYYVSLKLTSISIFCCCFCVVFVVCYLLFLLFCLFFVSPCPFLPVRILDLFTFICLCTNVSSVLSRVWAILSSIDQIVLTNCVKQWSLRYIWVPYTLFLCPSSAASTAVSTTRDSYWFYSLISISVLCYMGQHSGL